MTVHMRIVMAFVMREIATRYGRSPGGYLWALLEPIAFILMMTSLMGAFGRLPAMGDSFTLFYATGYVAFSMYKSMESYLASSISANKSLMNYPKVAPFDAIVARLLLQAMTSAVVAAVILYGSLWTTQRPVDIHWLYIIEAVIFAWIIALGIALANTVLFFKFPVYKKVFDIISRPLLLLSGIFYVPSQMPHPFSDYILANPLAQIVILFRQGFYTMHGDNGLDMLFLSEVSFSLLFIGLALFTFIPVARTRED